MTVPMSDERLAEIRAREQGVPPAPWRSEDDARTLERWILSEDGTLEIGLGYVGNRTEDVAAFIVNARQDIPDLLDEVARSRAVEYQCGHCGEWEPADGDDEGQFCQSCGAEMILDECDSRDVLTGLRTDLAAAHERVEMCRTRLQQALDDKNTAAAHATNRYSRLYLEHTRLAEQVKRVSALHRPVAAHAGDPDDDDTLMTACAYCSVPYPCQTIAALDGTEAGR
jgi:hypothetical protein